MVPENYKRLTCRECATVFVYPRKKAYCSDKCKWKVRARKLGMVPRAEYRARVRRGSPSIFTCEHCGKEAFRKISGTNKSKGIVNRWCSMECRKAAAAIARKAARAEQEALVAVRMKVAREVSALRRIAKYVERPTVFISACECCRAEFKVRRNAGPGQTKRLCEPCRTERAKQSRRASKLARKAVERGIEADLIDPIKVFERDKWRCHLCGARTPRKYRGTYHDRAPELEHIIALADGGSHTWGNVACACRKCNQEKGARSLGQLGLRISA